MNPKGWEMETRILLGILVFFSWLQGMLWQGSWVISGFLLLHVLLGVFLQYFFLGLKNSALLPLSFGVLFLERFLWVEFQIFSGSLVFWLIATCYFYYFKKLSIQKKIFFGFLFLLYIHFSSLPPGVLFPLFLLLSSELWRGDYKKRYHEAFKNTFLAYDPKSTGIRGYYDLDCGFCYKMIHGVYGFLGFSKNQIFPAQEVPEIEKEMLQKNSWVLVTATGEKFYRFDAFLELLKSSPYRMFYKILVFNLSISWNRKIGNSVYEWIANHRNFSSRVLYLLTWKWTDQSLLKKAWIGCGLLILFSAEVSSQKMRISLDQKLRQNGYLFQENPSPLERVVFSLSTHSSIR